VSHGFWIHFEAYIFDDIIGIKIWVTQNTQTHQSVGNYRSWEFITCRHPVSRTGVDEFTGESGESPTILDIGDKSPVHMTRFAKTFAPPLRKRTYGSGGEEKIFDFYACIATFGVCGERRK
jgi:hypothetical protein